MDASDNVVTDLTSCFEDKTFRIIVYNAVFKDAVDDANAIGEDLTLKNTNMRKLLAEYTGEIIANAKTIKNKNINNGELIESVYGIQFLTHANMVDLEHNKIEDWTVITATGNHSLNYYGFSSTDPNIDIDFDDRKEGYNVYWKIGGNPFELLPNNFGGRLVIAQAATTHSEYSLAKEKKFFFLRTDNVNGVTKTLPLENIKVKENGVESPATVLEVINKNHPAPYRKFVKNLQIEPNNEFSFLIDNLDTSGQEMIAVGMGQVIKYYTADGNDTDTPGAQSFKYYLHPYFYVYDKMIVETEDEASIVFTKTDADDTTIVLSGAVYELTNMKTNTTTTYTTNEKGQIRFENLEVGNYELKEVTAPAGYEKSKEVIKFSVVAPGSTAIPATVSITGGTEKFMSSESSTDVTADENGNNIRDAVYLGGKFDLDVDTNNINKEIAFTTGNLADI